MASSRAMRKSPRNASPMIPTALNSTPMESGAVLRRERLEVNDEWKEPALRPPAPSFEDHKGAERQGVLEHMAPLGTLPNQKSKLRVKQYDPTRLSLQARKAEAAQKGEASKESQKARSSGSSTRTSDVQKPEIRPQNKTVVREKEDDRDYTPLAAPAKTSQTPRGPSTRSSLTPNSKTPVGQERLRQVVESAVDRSRELGNEILGLAIRRLYEESLQNRTLADLLDAVLSQHPTPRQAADFQAYIKVARKTIKLENSSARSPSTGLTIVTKPESKKSSPKPPRRSRSRASLAALDNTNHSQTSTNSQNSRPNGKMDSTPPKEDEQPSSKRVKRSRSVSSTSTLSSTHSLEIDAADIDMVDEPIATPLGPGSRLRGLGGPRLHNFAAKQAAGVKRGASTASAAPSKDDPAEIEIANKKRKLQRTDFEGYDVRSSNIRASPTPSKKENSKTLPFLALHVAGTSRSVKAEDYEDLRSPASSAQGDLLVPPPPGAQRASRSRGATPNALGRPRNNLRRTARIKMSPMKKKNGVVAGVIRVTRTRESSVDQTDEGDGENVDYCSACGGSGELLCCDGCTRSFHFRCLDPPMNPNKPPEGEWFCYICESKRDPQARPFRGLFSGVSHRLSKSNPVAYSLPSPIREYFDGVKTGEEGEYEEASTTKTKNTKLIPGYDEIHNDNFKIKDAKNNVVLCFQCGKSALGRREIISCDYCSLKWHLDCLDPPMANPPVKDALNRPKYNWMCPAHVEQELLTLGRSGRPHKLRRPKNPKIVDTCLRRGLKNNGIIEIENEQSDAESIEPEDSGVIYRMTERSVKLDFIARVKAANADEARKLAEKERATERHAAREKAVALERQRAFDAQSIIDKQAALNLAEFSQRNHDVGIGPDHVHSLVNQLISEAPPKVVALILNDESAVRAAVEGSKPRQSVPPTPPISDPQERGISNSERQQLLLLQELIRRRLAEVEG